MSKRILSVAVAVTLFWSTVIVLAQEQVPAPSFKEGDAWQFNISRKGQLVSSTDQNDGTYELTFAQGKVKLFELSGSQKNEIPIQPDGSSQQLLFLVGNSEQQPGLRFPLSVGQKWTYEYETRPPNSRQAQRRSVEVSVTGMEQVTTPAGAFKAYKLIRSESWSGGRLGTRGGSTTTYFYSPETRSIVKRSGVSDNNPGTVETELIKFTPGN
jgi:hypothetical protein